jgi:RHH-type rel operon transcriptional repressor/antitoxin RelB
LYFGVPHVYDEYCIEDTMLSIRLDPDIERRLSELAKRTGRTKSYYARELIEGNIEDLEDRYLAEARLEKRRPPFTSRQVRKELGLEY